MSLFLKRSVTLLELIIAIVLLSIIIFGINSINSFSNYHVISSDRRANVQNQVSFCLEHITKEASKAIGNESVAGANSVVSIVPNTSLAIFVDGNRNGIRDTAGGDYWINYNLNAASHELRYCSNCGNSPSCPTCNYEVLSSKITAFTPDKDFSLGNHINISITGCHDPAQATAACGTQDNPEVTMDTTAFLPSVSTR